MKLSLIVGAKPKTTKLRSKCYIPAGKWKLVSDFDDSVVSVHSLASTFLQGKDPTNIDVPIGSMFEFMLATVGSETYINLHAERIES